MWLKFIDVRQMTVAFMQTFWNLFRNLNINDDFAK